MADVSIRETLFYCFSFLMTGSALGVVFHRNPVKSALFLVLFFLGLSAMYALLGAELLSTLQILVYVGAIMVLFLFVIMLIAVREENFENPGSNIPRSAVIALLCAAFAIQFLLLINIPKGKSEINVAAAYEKIIPGTSHKITGNAEVLSHSLFSDYLLPFELISLLLLVATIGAVVLAKKNRRELE